MYCRLLYLLLCLPALSLANSRCFTKYVNQSPALISTVSHNTQDKFLLNGRPSQTNSTSSPTGQKAILTEDIYDHNQTKTGKILRRGSIVLPTEEINFDKIHNDDFIQIKVMNASLENYNHLLENKALKAKEKGFLPKSSLKKMSGQMTFVLNKDAKLIQFGKDITVKAHMGLRPIQRNGKFKTKQCLINGKYRTLYLYNLVDHKGNLKEEIVLNSKSLACLSLSALPNKQHDKILDFTSHMKGLYGNSYDQSKLEYNEWGMVNLPSVIINPNTREIVSTAYDDSYVHYKGGDPLHSDAWGHPDTICEFASLAIKWKEKCKAMGYSDKRCTIQVGDISWITPGKKESNRDPLGHKHHHDGTCIDIRPLRVDNQQIGTTITYDTMGHDSKLNKELLSFLGKNKASPIYYNDPKVYNSLRKTNRDCNLKKPNKDLDKGVLPCKGHDNHIHFCLKPNRVKGCK